MTDRVMVRGVTSDAECVAACEVAAAVLTERVRAAGISQKAWAWLEGQKLLRSKPLWDHYGIAVDEGKVVGLVVVNVAGDSPLAVTCSEACCHVGCCGSLSSCWASALYKDFKLKPAKNEVYVELIAVHPDYQRMGVGSKLMNWVEHQGLHLLMDRFPEEIRAKGSRVLLETVTANTAAFGLFEYLGYEAVGYPKKSSCLAGLMQYTFGEGVYVTMSKRLSAAYQRAVQTPGKFKGKTMVVRVPLTVDMTRT